MTKVYLFSAALAGILAAVGCATSPPPSQADDANLATCTAQADATYNAQNYDQLSRTSQNGLRYSAMPNHVFDAQELGSLHERDDQITACVNNGTAGTASAAAALPGPPPAVPQIIGQ
jgi:hypothetical protein